VGGSRAFAVKRVRRISPERQAAKACEGDGVSRLRMPLRVCSHGTQVEPDGISLSLAGGESEKGKAGIFL